MASRVGGPRGSGDGGRPWRSRSRRAPPRLALPPLRTHRQHHPGHLICFSKALLEELIPADQQIRGRAAVASIGLACGPLGRREVEQVQEPLYEDLQGQEFEVAE